MGVDQEACPKFCGLQESVRVCGIGNGRGLTGNIAKLVIVEHRFTPFVTSHSPQIVLILFVEGCYGRLLP